MAAPPVDVAAGSLEELSGRFAWDGRALAITDSATLVALTQRRMSASTMVSMESCTARWAFEKVWPGQPDMFSPAEVGTGAHSVLEHLYGLPASDRTIHAAMTIVRQVASRTFPGETPLDLAVRDRWLAEVYSAFKGIFDIEDPKQVTVAGRELEVEATIAGVPFIGYVDRLDELETGLGIIDYKSSAELPKNIAMFGDHHGDQQRLYMLALKEMRGELPVSAWLYYSRLGKSKKVARSKARLADTRDRFVIAAERLSLCGDTALLPTVASGLCGWCPLVKVCPTAKAEGKTDRIASAPDPALLPIPVLRSGAAPAAERQPPPRETTTATDAAHHTDDANTHEGITMTRLMEGQPYVELKDGDLNPNSYASMAAVDYVDMAVRALADAQVPLTRSGVESLAGMFASVVADIQHTVTGTRSMQEGMNSRGRFIVKRLLRILPAPVHGDTAEWEAWAQKITRRAGLVWDVAYALWEDGSPSVDDPAELTTPLVDAITKAKTRSASANGHKPSSVSHPVTEGGRATGPAVAPGPGSEAEEVDTEPADEDEFTSDFVL